MKNKHRIAITFVLTALALTSLSACGDDGHSSGSGTAEGDDSAYCQVSIDWAVHEFTGLDESDPVATKQYAEDYLDYVNDATETAPDEIADDWTLSAARFTDFFFPTLEKYDYSFDRIKAEGTEQEQAVFDEPAPDVAAAEEQINAYDASVCASLQPPAADVQFDGPPPADYCKAVRAYVDSSLEAVYAGGTTLEEYVNSPEFTEQQAAVVDLAPDEISDDVAAVETFTTDEVLPVLERYGNDARRLFREGSYEERAIFLNSDDAVEDQYVQVRAYNQQLCNS